MSDAVIYIETDNLGRMCIGAEDKSGNGGGYRLAGRKYCGCCPGNTVVRKVLDDRDVEEIRRYLDRYDRMRAEKPEPASMTDPDEAAQQETLNGG